VKHIKKALASSCLLLSASTYAADLYVPLDDKALNARIDQMIILSNAPTMKKPYNVKLVKRYMRKIRRDYRAVYDEIAERLDRYDDEYGVQFANVSLAAANSEDVVLANEYGKQADSSFDASAALYYKPFDSIALSVGGSSTDSADYDGDRATLRNTYIAAGGDSLQIDIGYRDLWLSPFKTNARLFSNNAQQTFGVGISNAIPFESFANFQYHVSLHRLEEHSHILYGDELEVGRPYVMATHFSIEPFTGWTIALNRTMQFGGGSREVDFGSIVDAFIDPVSSDNTESSSFEGCESTQKNLCEFGNQLASLQTRLNFPGEIPFSIYGEYAGEDTAKHSNFRLGNIAVSAGINVPYIPLNDLGHLAVTVEASTWQNGWYSHHIYLDGYTNNNVGLGHWSQNQTGNHNGIPGQSFNVVVELFQDSGANYSLDYKMVENDDSRIAVKYDVGHELSLKHGRELWGHDIEGGITAGRTTFGDTYSRLELAVRLK